MRQIMKNLKTKTELKLTETSLGFRQEISKIEI